MTDDKTPPEAVPDEFDARLAAEERAARRRRIQMSCGRITIGLAFIAAWEAGVAIGLVDRFLYGRPLEIWEFLREQVVTAAWWRNVWTTLREMLLGVSIGGTAGIVAGAILGSWKGLNRLLQPYVVMLNSVPRLALAPMLIIWFGIGEASKVALVVSLIFFIMLINTRAGMQSTDPDVERVAIVLKATRIQRLVKVSLPSAVPSILGGLRLSISFGLLAAVAGELIAAKAGLGQVINWAAQMFNMSAVWAVIFSLALMAATLDFLLSRLESRLLRWQRTD